MSALDDILKKHIVNISAIEWAIWKLLDDNHQRSAAEQAADELVKWKEVAENLVSILGNVNTAETLVPRTVKLLVELGEKDLADALALTGFASAISAAK